jgi:hypothetical protein
MLKLEREKKKKSKINKKRSLPTAPIIAMGEKAV